MTEAFDPAAPAGPGDSHLTLLFKLMQAINEGADMNRVFALIGSTLRRIFENDRFSVALMYPDGLPHIVASEGLSVRYVRTVNGRLDESPGLRSVRERTPLYVLDATTDPNFEPFNEAAALEGFRTVLLFPMFTGTEPLGFLTIYHDTVRQYSPAELALAQALSQQAGVAMAQARLLGELEARRAELERQYARRSAEMDATDQIVLGIASSLEIDDTFDAVTEASARLAGATTASLFLRRDDGRFEAVASVGVPLEDVKKVTLNPQSGLLARMVETGRPAQVVDFLRDISNAAHGADEIVRDHAIRATLGVPLMQDRECVGALYVARDSPEQFPDDTARMLMRLAAFAYVGVSNARRFSDVEAERRRLQQYVDAIPEGVIIFDRAADVTLANDTFVRDLAGLPALVGSARDALLGEGGTFSGKDVRLHYEGSTVLYDVMERGQTRQGLLEAGEPRRLYEVHFNPLRHAGERIEGMVATLRDITDPIDLERERARSSLLAQLLQLSAHLNSDLSTAILIERVVEAAMALVGASAGTLGLVEGEELVFRRYHLPGGWTDFQIRLRIGQGAPGYVWETGRPYISNDSVNDSRVLQEQRRRLGFSRLVLVPVFDRSLKVIGTLGLYDPHNDRDFGQADVEALQLLAHQAAIAIENARLNELKDEFLSIVSHELKTPVTSIKGFTQILQRRLAPDVFPSGQRYLDIINHQADRLNGLINDLLDLSRIQTGRFVFDRATLDYGQLARDVVAEMRLVGAGHAIEYDGPDHLSAYGNGDRLRQVLVNLIDNAITHGPAEGAVHVTIEVRGGEVITYVCDEGADLPAAEAERIFAQYYQVRRGEERHARGLGLGLFISRRIVEEHGGRIWLDPADHTSFAFTVPHAFVPEPPREPASEDVEGHDLPHTSLLRH